MGPEFGAVPFQDVAKAESNLARLEARLAPRLLAPLASLLGQSPDPDGAANLLERCLEGASAEFLGALERHPSALTYLVAIFGYSGSLAEAFLADPSLAIQFARDRNFIKHKSKEDLMQDYARFSTTSPDLWLAARLAQFKRRNYLRIVLKDALRLSTLAETTLELSALADVILANALVYCEHELEKRYGLPQYRDVQGRIARSQFSIISLGKLGGNELNYSSDIDLLFLYSHNGETAGGSEPTSVISNKEYFVRLAHAITRTITQLTPYGQVFRIDLRLRPEGDQGDLTIALRSALEYYEHRARDWELQMLIKARHSAGDAPLTREFLRGVEPCVYGSPGDFEAVESVLWAREKISKKLRESRGDTIDVKRHRGGIRDIEFLTQCLQRLHGSREPWVRSGGTIHALRKLNDKGMLSDRDYAALTAAYEFLRKVEHRIQLDSGQQTHRLPSDQASLERLARRVGVEPEAGRHGGDALLHRLREALARVDEIYQRVIHRQAVPTSRVEFRLRPPLVAGGAHWPHSYEAILSFLDAQAPDLAARVREVSLPDRARPHAARFLAALLGSSDRFALAREQPAALRRALKVLGASPYLAELLIHHTEDLVVLSAASCEHPVAAAQLRMSPASPALEPSGPLRAPTAFGHQDTSPAAPSPFPWASEEGLAVREKVAAVRREYRMRALGLAARDCESLDSIFASLDRWSVLAGRSISSALAIAAQALEMGSHFAPASESASSGRARAGTPSLVVLGLGRLGLSEFDLASDADLVFVLTSGDASRRPGDGHDMLEWTRLAEKTIEVLSSYTRDGAVFAVDTRLRPRGHEGELVVTENALLRYLEEDAQAWEAMTYLKACPIAGDLELGSEIASRLVARLIARFASRPGLEAEVQEMRRRLERELEVRPSDTKTAPGGYYDVDFAVSYLRLCHRITLPPGSNVPDQITALRAAGWVSASDAQILHEGAAFLRSIDHAIRLVTGKPARGLPEHVGDAEAVESLARRWGVLGPPEGSGGQPHLAARLRDVQQEVRHAYRRLISSE